MVSKREVDRIRRDIDALSEVVSPGEDCSAVYPTTFRSLVERFVSRFEDTEIPLDDNQRPDYSVLSVNQKMLLANVVRYTREEITDRGE